MTDEVLVLRKLTLLREHIGRVRRRRPSTLEAFAADIDLQDATAMSLMVAIQEALDIALHIAADEGWGVPASYAGGFDLLAKHGLIDNGLAGELARVAAVRNRIAHGYATVDLERLYREIPSGVDTLERFGHAVAQFADTDAKSRENQ